ncbi:hypothetical protein TUM22923_13240 [Polynucleobacter sp. TUM22923]|jgi:TRAP-type uncharacterized transport system substrate-binding protein|uniref:TAXI family TRAP transporter solute-binding subunit n=1 Tax=Polynucleobacter sp. TUM22923 TaxID=3022126 RepID=UPI00257347CA|nr:TAXI family TRAP transporter solute-binding subunit [Polynucleobacter sp. TUM22923]BDX22003.1 hypothetical protein TUM22923_13240 [Polynucleobacter sp. TUM22923]
MDFIRKNIYSPSVIGVAILLLGLILFAVLWILVPPPPRSIELATGFSEGLYQQFGKKLQHQLSGEGVSLTLKTTGGTRDNIALLDDPNSGIDFALVQGGVADISKYPNLVSIAGIFYEPIWVWYREAAFKKEGGRLSLLSQIKGKRVSIGSDGSGTLALTMELMRVSGLSVDDFRAEKLRPDEALAKFSSAELDVVFLVSAIEAPLLKKFYQIPDIRLMGFEQADAYLTQLPYLSKVKVPRGVLSIAQDIPRQDMKS